MCSLAGRRLHWGSFLFFVMLGRLRDHWRRSRGSKGSVAPPPPVEICESPTPRFGAEKTFTDVLDNTCGHRRLQNAHFLPSDGTQWKMQQITTKGHSTLMMIEYFPTGSLRKEKYFTNNIVHSILYFLLEYLTFLMTHFWQQAFGVWLANMCYKLI